MRPGDLTRLGQKWEKNLTKKTVTVMTYIIKSPSRKNKQEISLPTFIKNIDFNSGFSYTNILTRVIYII